ncbi:hypothetical protein P3X46_007463 [Hevea brasiliensis]|uniref:YGGT family protein n=1 Tax=Hevea brasiliensis TaxID=3981 RepID=A0ABQ9MXD2_HEVBR|nr:ylmG homolog protein 2, chloroplastic [Hevea brasiliensis]KAJ9183638.1 hypothetical protein P3X46_007463 [Hevea brasiliensis]
MASRENSTSTVPSVAPSFVLLSSWIAHNPFLRPLKLNLASPNGMIRELHLSLTSTAEKCSRFLHLFASENPIFKRLLSFSSHFRHHLAQFQCRDYRNPNSLSNHTFAAVLPGDSVAGIVVANGIINFLNIYNTLLIVRLVLTWFPNSPPAIVSPLSTLCDPYLNIFRGIIPPLGGTLDFSPILAFLVLNAFTSTAAALPAELPGTEASQGNCPPHRRFTNLTTSQNKWMRRCYGNKAQSSTGAN